MTEWEELVKRGREQFEAELKAILPRVDIHTKGTVIWPKYWTVEIEALCRKAKSTSPLILILKFLQYLPKIFFS